MSAALPSFSPAAAPEGSRAAALAQLRDDLARRFPGAVPASLSTPHPSHRTHHGASRDPRDEVRLAELRRAAFLWVEAQVGQGGLAWLAAWTSLRLADDPLGRPALWIDTHGTLTPGELLDLEGRLVVVRPADPHEAHVAADIALRAGSFCLVALEMHRALHPTALARLSRLAGSRRAGSGLVRAPASTAAVPEESHTPLVLWGEPPPFVAPPSGIARTPLLDVVTALLGDRRVLLPGAHPREQERAHAREQDEARDEIRDPTQRAPSPHDGHEPPTFTEPTDVSSELVSFRAPHTTDRLRPMDRAADRRAPASSPRPGRPDLVDPAADHDHDHDRAGAGSPRPTP